MGIRGGPGMRRITTEVFFGIDSPSRYSEISNPDNK